MLSDGRVATASADGSAVLLVDPINRHATRIETGLLEAHDLVPARTTPAGAEALWIADPGFHCTMRSGQVIEVLGTGRVVLIDLGGVLVRELPAPTLGPAGPWRPTAVAPTDYGVWVADGYGRQVVELYDEQGRVAFSTDGSETGLAFVEPHALLVDSRSGGESVIVADRGNRRLVVLSPHGDVIRIITDPLLDSPSGLTLLGDSLMITELRSGISRIDEDWRVTGFASIDDADCPRSPHGIAAAPTGELYVTEWCVGGRLRVLPTVATVG